MDLVKEFKSAIKKPLKFQSLSIIFVTFFLILIVGLCMTSLLRHYDSVINPRTACDKTGVKKVKNSVNKNNDAIYQFSFNGNKQCFMNAWFTWNKPTEQIILWVYDPKGSVSIIEPSYNQTNVTFLANSPLENGNWRIIVKTTSSSSIVFSGEIAFR